MKLKEEWRPVKGYEGIYAISNTGIVVSIKKRVFRKQKLIKTDINDVTQFCDSHDRQFIRVYGTKKERIYEHIDVLMVQAFPELMKISWK